jgi:hypothetical protein
MLHSYCKLPLVTDPTKFECVKMDDKNQYCGD